MNEHEMILIIFFLIFISKLIQVILRKIAKKKRKVNDNSLLMKVHKLEKALEEKHKQGRKLPFNDFTVSSDMKKAGGF